MEIEVEKLPKALRRRGLEDKLAQICKDNSVVFLAMFGSFVRGEQNTKSDVDIAIEFDKSKRKTLLDLVRLEDELSKVFKRKVDLGVFSSLNPYVVEDVRREMRVIYEKRYKTYGQFFW
jgi:predicted nucleotidyltransferase